jgi:hypothetical protein
MPEPTAAAAQMNLVYADLLERTRTAGGAVLMELGHEVYRVFMRGQIAERQLVELNRIWQARMKVLVAPDWADELRDLLAELFAVYNDCESCAAPDLARRVSLATRGMPDE